jgi:glycosyltransferase involved in cell wall biosynthesis
VAGRDPIDLDLPAETPTAGRVVHLLASRDAALVRHVAALTRSQALSGVPQTVVALDGAALRVLLPRFDAEVNLVLVADRPRRRVPRDLLGALRAELRDAPASAVHAHGWLASALGIFAARLGGLAVPLRCTGMGRRTRRGLARAAATFGHSALPAMRAAPAEPLCADLPEELFGLARREARRPLVVTSSAGPDARHAARFAQLAVLLGPSSAGIAFNWIGPADANATAQLTAAGVGQHDATGALRRTARLRPAWIYAALGSDASASRGLVEAMAMGLPCIAWDGAEHRALIEHGRTGLLCASEEALLEAVAALVDSAELRTRLGDAGRDAARRIVARSSAATRAGQEAGSPAAAPTAPSGALLLDR